MNWTYSRYTAVRHRDLSGAAGANYFITAATLAAGAALWQQEGHSTITLPLMAALILLSYSVRYRIERPLVRNICRAILYIAVMVIYRTRPPNSEFTFVDTYMMDQVAELCVAEIVIRAWSRYTSDKYNSGFMVLPVGFIYVVATNTYNDNVGRYFTPIFMLLLTLGIQSMRKAALPDTARRARPGVIAAITFSTVFGMVLYHALFVNRDALTEWANRVLNSSKLPLTSTGLSDESHLSSIFGRSGSYDRVMRIHSSDATDISYMRAYSMYNYLQGVWQPGARIGRVYKPVSEAQLEPTDAGTQAQIFRYSGRPPIIFAPLNTLAIECDGAVNLRWAQEEGGPLICNPPVPDTYAMRIGDPGEQGLFCNTPGAVHLQQLLSIPPEINPKINKLAKEITSGTKDPLRKARAIEAYLPAHHAYSQHIRVNPRDPLGDFLFSDKAAHCEFFASAAVILMRCAGIPARYVIGYYAHEEEGGDNIVRQRDAHAWAECWIKGIGWVTIDATPASGRPRSEPVPGWKHAIEEMQDWFANFRQKITPENIARFAGVLVCLVLAVTLLQNRYHFTWRRVRSQPAKEYTAAAAELRNLYSRFEAICRKCDLICPSSVPWQQYLSAVLDRTITEPGERTHSVERIRAAAEFVSAYDLARFGRRARPGEYVELGNRLDLFERQTEAAVVEEKRL